MDPMLESFLQESRENLESASRCFLNIEKNVDSEEIINDLFRSIHTIKGSSGLFDIAPLTRVVHAAEDILDETREGNFTLNSEHIDLFLDCMDQVESWLDDLENLGSLDSEAEKIGQILSEKLRGLLGKTEYTEGHKKIEVVKKPKSDIVNELPEWFQHVPNDVRLSCFADKLNNDIFIIEYTPDSQCFFNGDDPINTVQGLKGLRWYTIEAKDEWGELLRLDPFQCNLVIKMLVTDKELAIRDYFRYVAEQLKITQLKATQLIFPVGELGDVSTYEALIKDAISAVEDNDFNSLKQYIGPLVEIGSADLIQTSALEWILLLLKHQYHSEYWLNALIDSLSSGVFISPSHHTIEDSITEDANLTKTTPRTTNSSKKNVLISELPESTLKVFSTQLHILGMPCTNSMLAGRIKSTVKLLTRIFKSLGWDGLLAALGAAGEVSIKSGVCEPLETYLQQCLTNDMPTKTPQGTELPDEEKQGTEKHNSIHTEATLETEVQHNRRASDKAESSSKLQSKTLRVDQERIDTLMDLVGELVVAKNSLPFLARRAEEKFKVKALGKEIKSQYSVINRLAEELQSTIMSVRMVPVSSVFNRFPRLVRDLSRRLEKKIELVMEGEETEADKNVIENLADPLIHLVRNSLDHGIESPAERVATGKPEKGTIILRATPMDDQVIIDIIDDGKGIDPDVIKLKAYKNGIIDEAKLDSISDQEAIELIFSAGLSSKEEASDLSGRGVGMDVVRTAVNDAGGQVSLTSELGKGSKVSLSLPLSMAVAQVMMIEIDDQTYGISMDCIRETVRVPSTAIQHIKHNEAIVLRDTLIPVRRLRKLLNLPNYEQQLTEEAVLIVSVKGEEIGLIIDDFHEGIDVIQKPLEGVMSSYPIYAGATLLGDGRVLLILDLAEII